ncbi:MAG: glucokinase [Pseudomonadota bacterium]
MKVLACDVGGTKTLLMIAHVEGVKCTPLHERSFASAAYHDFEVMLAEFIDDLHEELWPVAGACLGVAGPVSGGHAMITNLPWDIDARLLSEHFDIPRVVLINDFQAIGYGIAGLREDQLVVLQTGAPDQHGVKALIGAGTGLGEGIMVWNGRHYQVQPTEGGHVDFAPVDAVQIELLQWLLKRQARVSYENVVSGGGLASIYDFLTEKHPARQNAALTAALKEGDRAATIARFALESGDALAGEAVDLFLRIYGAQAGNLALTTLPYGGVYLAGGIAPKLITRIQQGGFMDAFHDKEPMAELMHRFPVKVIMEPRIGVIGAALRAAQTE